MSKKLNGGGTGPLNGLGDIAPPNLDPMDRYYHILRGQLMLPKRGWIVTPKWEPPKVEGMERFQEIYEQHELPRQWQLAEDFFTLLQRGRFMVKRPNWIEPPITAEMEDLVSEEEFIEQWTSALKETAPLVSEAPEEMTKSDVAAYVAYRYPHLDAGRRGALVSGVLGR